MFSECASLREITVPEGVDYIGEYAFEKCSQLTTVNLPGSVETIDNDCFRECPALTTINYGGAKWQWEQAYWIPSDVTQLGISDSVTINFFPGGQCGDGAYWSYDPDNNLLHIWGDDQSVVERPTDGSEAAWDAALQANPFIFMEDIDGIQSEDFANRMVHDYSSGYIDSDALPTGTIVHQLKSESGSHITAELCQTGGHTQGYLCDDGCALPEVLVSKTFGPQPHSVGEIRALATCVSEGKKCGVKCYRCEEILVEPLITPIDSSYHYPTKRVIICEVITKLPTDTESGSEIVTYQCEDCGATWEKDEFLPAGTIPDIGGSYDPSNPIIYTITFDPNDGILAPGPNTKNTFDNGRLTALPANPTRTGHAFRGWYTGPADGTKITTALTFRKDVTVYAHWVERIGNICTITFDANDGSGDSIFDVQVTDSDGRLEALPDLIPTREGYTFLGWYTAASNGEEVTLSTTFQADTTVYARWASNDTPSGNGVHTITFNANGGTFLTGGTVVTLDTDSKGQLSNPPEPTRQCHTFIVWYILEDDEAIAISLEKIFDADTTVYAGWKEQSHTPETLARKEPTCTASGLTEGSKCSLCGTVLKEQETIPAPGHNWVSNGTGVEAITKQPTCTVDGEKTITGGVKCSRCNLETQEPITTSISAPGHTWGEWKTSSEGGAKERECSVCHEKETASGSTVTPGGDNKPGDSKTFTVTFNPNGGAGGATQTTNTDGRLSALPNNPTRVGYAFMGWFTAVSGGERITTSTVFQENTTVYAQWEVDSISANRYEIYTPYRTTGGSYDVSHSSAAMGTRVTIELSPRRNYELDWLSVTNLDTGRELRLTKYSDDEYTFIMPASSVEIDLAFISKYASGISSQPQIRSESSKWYYNGSIYHVNNGLVPAHSLFTRDMLVSILYNFDTTSSGEPEFWAVKNAVVTDIYDNWLWGADKAINREQMAMVLFNYAKHKGYNVYSSVNLTGFTDYDLLRPIARPAMSWAQAAGLITGPTADLLFPQGILTCEQANSILSRFVSTVAWTR